MFSFLAGDRLRQMLRKMKIKEFPARVTVLFTGGSFFSMIMHKKSLLVLFLFNNLIINKLTFFSYYSILNLGYSVFG